MKAIINMDGCTITELEVQPRDVQFEHQRDNILRTLEKEHYTFVGCFNMRIS